MRRASRGRRRHRHRRAGDRAAGAGHRRRRRGHHLAALGRLHGARDHDGGRAAGVRRHRSRPADDRSGGRRRRGHAAHAAIMPVHLYGQAADMPAIVASPSGTAWRSSRTAARRTWPPAAGRPVGSFGAAAAYSFYPTKNLGALGDGGAIRQTTRRRRRAQAAAQRRPDRSLPSRRVRRELAGGRAGGGVGRAAAAPPPPGGGRRGARGRVARAGRRGAGPSRCPLNGTRGTSITSSRC